MLRTGDILDLGPLDTQLIIKKTAVETEGQSFEMEMVVGPKNPGPPLHIHALLHFAVMMAGYPEEIRSVKPPDRVMRLFGWIGRLLGYQA